MTKSKKEKHRSYDSDADSKYLKRHKRERSPSTEDNRSERKHTDYRRHRNEDKSKHYKSRDQSSARTHANRRRSTSSQSEERHGKYSKLKHRSKRSLSSDKPQRQYSKSYFDNQGCSKDRGMSKHIDKKKFERRSSSPGDSRTNNKKRRSRREPSSSSVESDEHTEEKSEDLVRHLQEERRRLKEEKKKQKETIKSTETPEEKRLRRLLKKEAKERKRKERMGWDKDYMHYTNTDNPFGDANLLETFVWNKKLEKEGLSKVDNEEMERRNRLKQEENRLELEKVKKRRQEWEQERARRDDELQLLQREKEAAQFKEWEQQEDNFHLQQARLRSSIRIKDGRAKPIDLLARYISAEEEDLAVEMHEPYTYLNGLTITDLEDLLEDIKVYMVLEKSKYLDYWNDITVIVEDELNKLCKLDTKDHFGDRREGIHTSVTADIFSLLKGKTQAQLLGMQQNIQQKIHGGEEGIDIGYWESVLKQVVVHIAKARVRDRHQDNLRRKLFQLKQEQGVKTEPLFPIMAAEEEDNSIELNTENTAEHDTNVALKQEETAEQNTEPPAELEDVPEEESENAASVEDFLSQCLADYTAGCYSPKLLQPSDLEPGTIIIEEFEDSQKLQYIRQMLVGTGRVQDTLTAEEKAFEREARKGMDDEEALFSVESPVDKVYLWSDKYRPRKPRYFNRVHTGFEWNKYNQTHYDMDNPPPKIVQGYKFNIFYPDLIDKSSSPEYTLTPCDDNKDFAILRFKSSPPYEDIAFKIVNREWEYSYKRGFRCQFHNNIFQLWFHFKRYRYRR